MTDLADLQGHWRRAWIKAPGHYDEHTHVHWMQCGQAYADIRIPADLPDLTGVQALSELDPALLLGLMSSEGFAGTIAVKASVCTWARRINWHGTPTGVDAGYMSFDADGALVEDGVHAEYQELWLREDDPPVRADVFQSGDAEGVLLSSPSRFVLAYGKIDAPASAPLTQALTEGYVPEALSMHFASVYALGRWEGTVGIAEKCTNPLMNRASILHLADQSLELNLMHFDGSWRSTRATTTRAS